MTVKELIDELSKFDPDSEIISYNNTTQHWFKTMKVTNYQITTVDNIYDKCGKYAKKQLDSFNKSDVAIIL